MAFKPSVFTCLTMASGASTVTATLDGAWVYVYLQIPTMNAGYSTNSSPVWIQGSTDGTTYFRVSNVETNTSTVGANDFSIVSGASQRIVPLPNLGLKYMAVEISGAATGAGASPSPFKFICVPNQ